MMSLLYNVMYRDMIRITDGLKIRELFEPAPRLAIQHQRSVYLRPRQENVWHPFKYVWKANCENNVSFIMKNTPG